MKRQSFKMIVVGDSGVGKTCLVQKFVKGNFFSNYNMTIGIEFESKDVVIDNEKYQL